MKGKKARDKILLYVESEAEPLANALDTHTRGTIQSVSAVSLSSVVSSSFFSLLGSVLPRPGRLPILARVPRISVDESLPRDALDLLTITYVRSRRCNCVYPPHFPLNFSTDTRKYMGVIKVELNDAFHP